MIQIFVNGGELALYKDTTLNIEFNNALFSTNNITGDVVYNFDLPVKGNEILLNHINEATATSEKSYDCILKLERVVAMNGILSITRVNFNTISASIIITPYPADFAEGKITENKSPEITISKTANEHNAAWRAFLESTLTNDNIKFAPFINEDAYNNNDNYGFWNGEKRDKIINPIHFNENGKIIESTQRPFSQYKNAVFETDINQISFAPQIRLCYLLQIWCKNAGYTFINHLGEDLENIFVQSPVLLDGTKAQYQQQTNVENFNIFKKHFFISDCLPNITNSEFINNILKTLGLCYFVSNDTKEIEIIPFADIKDAPALNLSEYVLPRETEITIPDDKTQTFTLQPVTATDYINAERLPNSERYLPDASENYSKVILLTETNTIYKASEEETEDGDKVVKWQEFSGNHDAIITGTGKKEKTETQIKIPHQRFINTTSYNGTPAQYAVANFEMQSNIYNESKSTEFILTYYRGVAESYTSTRQKYYTEVMLPVWKNDFALNTTARNSLGRKYILPYLKLQNNKTITYKLIIPTAKIQEIRTLLQPSKTKNINRVMFINGVKTLPKTLQFQVDNEPNTLCEIEAVEIFN